MTEAVLPMLDLERFPEYPELHNAALSQDTPKLQTSASAVQNAYQSTAMVMTGETMILIMINVRLLIMKTDNDV